MDNFRSFAHFNGKTVEVNLHTEWSSPSYWILKFDDGKKLKVNEAWNNGSSTQFTTFSFYHYNKDWDDKEFQADIIEAFRENWDNYGNSEDVLRIIFKYVGYNAQNVEQDKAIIRKLEEDVVFATERAYKEIDRLVVDSETFKPKDFDFEEFETILDELKAFGRAKQDMIAVSKERIAFFNRLEAGEEVGVGYTNASFWKNFAGSDEGVAVHKILEDNGYFEGTK